MDEIGNGAPSLDVLSAAIRGSAMPDPWGAEMAAVWRNASPETIAKNQNNLFCLAALGKLPAPPTT